MTASAPASAIRRRQPFSAGRLTVTILLSLYAFVAIGPLLLMVSNSLRPSRGIYTDPVGLPIPPTFASYQLAWTKGNFSQYFLNSFTVTTCSVLLTIIVAVPAAYAIARSTSKIVGTIEAVFISGLMLPVHLAILPLFYLMDSLRLVDNPVSLVFIYSALGIPFSIFILTSFFRQLPIELEEASELDGAGPFRRFVSVMLPLVRPAIATVAIFRFVPIWNDFLFPLVLMRSPQHYTLPVGLTSFFGQYQTDWSALFAGLVIATIPLVVLFLLATKQIISGLTAGMSK
ncbi:carbohydrate ABC transporter permease [Microbacterium soli]|uniref:Carbohydrate ABC transporter permease n=1 Tax=Microbacterium soli TaxID=446075 RepID=A0ABP7MYX6_9MICO